MADEANEWEPWRDTYEGPMRERPGPDGVPVDVEFGNAAYLNALEDQVALLAEARTGGWLNHWHNCDAGIRGTEHAPNGCICGFDKFLARIDQAEVVK